MPKRDALVDPLVGDLLAQFGLGRAGGARDHIVKDDERLLPCGGASGRASALTA